jgi:hypothetical protein
MSGAALHQVQESKNVHSGIVSRIRDRPSDIRLRSMMAYEIKPGRCEHAAKRRHITDIALMKRGPGIDVRFDAGRQVVNYCHGVTMVDQAIHNGGSDKTSSSGDEDSHTPGHLRLSLSGKASL